MRMDLSREEEIKNLPSESLGLVSMNAFQKDFIERIGCRVQPLKLKDLNSNQSKSFKSIKKALLEFRLERMLDCIGLFSLLLGLCLLVRTRLIFAYWIDR